MEDHPNLSPIDKAWIELAVQRLDEIRAGGDVLIDGDEAMRRANAVLSEAPNSGFATPEIEAAWSEEIKRRLEDLEAGRTRTVSWEEVSARLDAHRDAP